MGGEAMTPEEMEKFVNDRQNSGEDALLDELKRMTREQERNERVDRVNLLSATFFRPLRGRIFVVHLHIEIVCNGDCNGIYR